MVNFKYEMRRKRKYFYEEKRVMNFEYNFRSIKELASFTAFDQFLVILYTFICLFFSLCAKISHDWRGERYY